LEEGVLFARDGGLDDLFGERYDLAEPRLEIIERTNAVIHLAASVRPGRRESGKSQLGPFQANPWSITRHETGLRCLSHVPDQSAREDTLAAVGLAGPLLKDEGAKIFEVDT